MVRTEFDEEKEMKREEKQIIRSEKKVYIRMKMNEPNNNNNENKKKITEE